jgi:4-hydroxythreonine-4-phosphate dehydrogenase
MSTDNNTDYKPLIGITLGDAAGIGAEIVCKAVAVGALQKMGRPIIIDSESILKRGMQQSGVSFPYCVIHSIEEAKSTTQLPLLPLSQLKAEEITMGKCSIELGKDEGTLLVRCIEYCQIKELDGFCFAPLNKGAMKKAGFLYPSEHEMFAHYYGQNDGYGEVNYVHGLWNIRVTGHIPLKNIFPCITIENILATARLAYSTLQRAGIKNPRIAVAALNPHSGENGTCGREEIEVIIPAIQKAAELGMPLAGPFASDTLFVKAFKEKYDGVITMYHDQGQIAIKLQDFSHCVTISAGLPNPITTPAHGTAYDIAGKGLANPSAFIDAYNICCSMAKAFVAESVI